MKGQKLLLSVVRYATFGAVMYVAIQLSWYFGIEEKSWLQRSWGFATGGSLGLIAGLLFFVAIGAIGWVSGPFFGSLGLVSLMLGGGLSGLGLGSLVDAFRDPERYEFNWLIICAVLMIGFLSARVLSSAAVRAASRRLQSTMIEGQTANEAPSSLGPDHR